MTIEIKNSALIAARDCLEAVRDSFADAIGYDSDKDTNFHEDFRLIAETLVRIEEAIECS